jgi:hypothetical protein
MDRALSDSPDVADLVADPRAIRAQLGKTRVDIAEALGSSQSRVSDLEGQSPASATAAFA